MLLIGASTFGQKLDKVSFGKFNYTQVPSDITLIPYSTFFVEVSVPDGNVYHVDETRAASQLEGFKKTTDESLADFKLRYTIYTTRFNEPKYTLQEHVKEKDGVKTKTYTHTYKGSYSFRTKLQIFDLEDRLLYEVEEEGAQSVSQSSSTKNGAKNKYNGSIEKLRSSITPNTIKKLNTATAEVFGYMQKPIEAKFVKVKPKKYEYNAFNDAVDAMQKLMHEEDMEVIRQVCLESIVAWEEDLEESDVTSSKARINKKVTAAAYYNIGMASFMMEDYEKAELSFRKAADYVSNVTLYHGTMMKISEDMIQRTAVHAH